MGVAAETRTPRRPPHAGCPVRRGRCRRPPHRRVDRPVPRGRRRRTLHRRADRLTPAVPFHVGVAAEAPPSRRPSCPTWASPTKPHRRAERLTPAVLPHVGAADETPPSRRPPHADRPDPRGRRRRNPTVAPTASRRPFRPTWASPRKPHVALTVPSDVGVAAETPRRADRPVPRGRSRRNPHRRADRLTPTVLSHVGVADETRTVAPTASRRPSCPTGRRRRNPTVAPSASRRLSRPTWASPSKPAPSRDRPVSTRASPTKRHRRRPPHADRSVHEGVADETPRSRRPSRPTWASPTKRHRRADRLEPTVPPRVAVGDIRRTSRTERRAARLTVAAIERQARRRGDERGVGASSALGVPARDRGACGEARVDFTADRRRRCRFSFDAISQGTRARTDVPPSIARPGVARRALAADHLVRFESRLRGRVRGSTLILRGRKSP